MALCLSYVYNKWHTYVDTVMRTRSAHKDKRQIHREMICLDNALWAVPWLRRLVAGFSPPRPGFDPRLAHTIFAMDKVALWQVFLPVLQFCTVSIIRPLLHTHSFIYMLPLPGQKGEAFEPSKKQYSCGNRGALDSKVLYSVCVLTWQRALINLYSVGSR
jgi:hypothetical protein